MLVSLFGRLSANGIADVAMVDQWAADKGCLLPKPEDSEYTQIMRELGEMV